ncbi:DUF5103 domain-containing protein [Labilibacter sediminis]|nr:DUF5103 domain-containing protein [Labilibacter sediminis]
MINKIYRVLFLMILTSQISFAQPLTNQIFNNQIKTVRCHKFGWELSYPLINMGSNDKIILSFDDLSADTKNYYYSIIHCNENWEPSQLMEQEYIVGTNQNPILDYQYSFNTSIDYVHYKLLIPNKDVQLSASGNYIIKVYEDFDDSNPVFTRRFMLVEQHVNIHPQVKFAMNAELRKANQEIDFNITYPNFPMSNPLQEVKVKIYQNQRTDNAISDLAPQFIRNNELVYNYNRETMFEGGNEFRWLDIRSIRFQSDKIKNITFHDPYSHIELFPDIITRDASYFFKNDFNGRYIIEVQEQRDHEIESEYVFVHFSLPVKEPYVGGDVHLLGGLTDWKLNKRSKMKYNYNFKQYEISLLLKQGFYNYQFAFKPNNSDKASVSMFEGSHGQTENDYLILVYYRGIGDYADRLIGAKSFNSLKP